MIFFKYLIYVTLLSSVILQCICQDQEPLFDLPVQLIGFPVIVLSVRLANFAKKLAYALNPATYQARSKRNSEFKDSYSKFVEQEIIKEFGTDACIYEEPCKAAAELDFLKPNMQNTLRQAYAHNFQIDQWKAISSVIGEITKETEICKRLAAKLKCNNI